MDSDRRSTELRALSTPTTFPGATIGERIDAMPRLPCSVCPWYRDLEMADGPATGPRAGCFAKVSGTALHGLLEDAFSEVYGASAPDHPMVTPTDSGVISFGGSDLLASLDMNPLFGPDAELAGRIAALHAFGDVYASGGTPRWSLIALVASRGEPLDRATRVLAGLLRACKDENVSVIGGHTIYGTEAMAGLAVIGVPGHRIRGKSGAQPGDAILLSKPLGSGLLIRANAAGLLKPDVLLRELRVVATSSAPAAAAASSAEISASTDVSGYGLLGHLSEMMAASSCGAELDLAELPIFPGVREASSELALSSQDRANYAYAASRISISESVDATTLALILDPQTCGGLLVATAGPGIAHLQANGFKRIGVVTSERVIRVINGRDRQPPA